MVCATAARALLLPALLTVLQASPASPASIGTPVFLKFFDVGDGDAVLIHQPGQCAVLVDAGPPGSGTEIGRQLGKRQISRLDRLIVSHPHSDHFGGILDLPEDIAIGPVSDNGLDFPAEPFFPAYRTWRQQQDYRPLAAGDQWHCGDIAFTVLAVDPDKNRPEEINDSSIVLLAEMGPVRLLLPGDIEAGGRRRLTAAPGRIRAAIVKIPHHAKSAGHLGPWLDAVRPELSVISAGGDTAPAPGALSLIRHKSGETWQTGLQGSLELLIDSQGWRHAR
jgi:competence protein ComEC